MKRRALVSKWGRGVWHVCHVRGTHMDGQCATFPTHAAALAHAMAETGLAPLDPGAWRCPMRATDPITTRRPREDGWRCGHEAGHTGSHTLYSDEGERVLFAGRWDHMAEVGLTKKEEARS